MEKGGKTSCYLRKRVAMWPSFSFLAYSASGKGGGGKGVSGGVVVLAPSPAAKRERARNRPPEKPRSRAAIHRLWTVFGERKMEGEKRGKNHKPVETMPPPPA